MVNGSKGIDRLGIKPYDWWNEALHGVARNGRATIFPQSLALAATFDESLIEEVASAISDEARAKFNLAQAAENYAIYTGLTFWSPNVNIFRDPRWGRGQETYGEDPYLTGKIGVAFVKGMQGDDPRYLKTAACAKHYAVHSGPEALRHHFDANPTKKDLYETYLPAFEMLVKEGNVEAVMGAYNRVYGESASASKLLLTDILRKRWGFEGHILSDCGAVADIYRGHGIAKDAAEAAAIALNNSLDLNCGTTFLSLTTSVERGLVTEAQIDAALKKLVLTKLKLGLLGDNSANPYNKLGAEVICSEKNLALARKASQNSIVLVSNKNNTLPLRKDLKSLGITGAYASDGYVLMGNYNGITNNLVTFVEGLVDKVDISCRVGYGPGIMPATPNINPQSWIDGCDGDVDATIVSIGLSPMFEGEEGAAIASLDIGDNLSMAIPKHQIEYLRKVKERAENEVIAVVTGCSGMDLREVEEIADAVLLVWYPGQEGGHALADVIFGDVSPSGRLPITFPMSVEQLPDFESYDMAGRTYRYMMDKPMYTFGYGLSYTTFDYSNLEVVNQPKRKNSKFDDITLRFTLTNSGKYAADEVVQTYVSIPGAGEANPISSLVGFERVSLAAGESKQVEVVVAKDQLNAITEAGMELLQQGSYTIKVGNASPSERSAELGGKWLETSFELNKKGLITF